MSKKIPYILLLAFILMFPLYWLFAGHFIQETTTQLIIGALCLLLILFLVSKSVKR
ncbi:hypothetical protein BCE02nite_32440 [Brevibacillus centrosporus]|nr:hypothetical protein BCE02nite_32440 [Brevibacillus centrosporus]